MTYKTSPKITPKTPQTRAAKGKRGSKHDLQIKSAKGLDGGKRPIYGDLSTQNSARSYPGR